MIKIRALNEESSEESEGDEDVPSLTKEAQEQAAFTRYNEALGMIRENNLDAARATLQELLEHNFLLEVQKQERTEGLAHPALILKYSCLKNMGTVLEKQGELQGALQHYLQAAELDGTDVSLWYRVGTVAISVIDYELACDALLEGLRCSSQHWPCLDSLITVLYVLNDYIPCLLYISRAFELDPDFLKGQALRDKILQEQPSIIDDFNAYCKGYELGQLNGEYDKEIGKEIIQEALDMREKKRKLYSGVFTPKPLETICLVRPLLAKNWVALGESLVQLHRHIEENDKIRHFCCPVDLESTVGMVNGLDKEQNPQVEPMDVDQSANEEGKIGVSETVVQNGTIEDDGLIDGAVETDDSKTKKKRRSSLSFLEQWMWGGKRRSARVRSTVKREAEREDGSNLEEALRRLVPQSLLPKVMKDEKRKELEAMKTTDESLDTMDLYKLFERRESTEGRSDDNQRSAAVSPSREKGDITKVISEESYFGTEKETKDVEEFILSNTKHDIIDILLNYVKIISKMWELTWSEQQTTVYLESYQCMRKHVQHPSVFSSDEDLEWIKDDSYITLLFGELFLDRWRLHKESSDTKILCEDNIPAEAIGQLVFVSVQENLFGKDHLKFILRLYWLKAHVFLNQGSPEVAMESFNTMLLYLDEKCDENNKEKVFLPNCKHHNVINIDVARKLLNMLTRNRSLCEVQYLYDEQHYEELVEILKETFHYSQQSQLLSLLPGSSTDACPDRATQLAMLMDALCKLKRYEDCFYWGEACCNEALHKYLNSEDKEQTKWASTVEKLLSGLESCVNKAGLEVIDNMPTNRLTRLVQNLTHTVCHQLEAPESAVEMPIESISPWILLQQILQHHEERKSRSSSDEDEYQENARSGELPGFISVLFTAHEFLGRRSWCCSSEGALLLHTMDVVIPRLRDEKLALVRDKVNQGLEQVFSCLYAHPNKKIKARYLQDHGVPQISLTWERGMQLYQFYQPEELPEFDSYRVISITADVESLFRRIAYLIPAHCNPAHLVEKVVAYVEGTSPSLPVLGDARSQLPRSVSAIYYLLADYYFKANEWRKAIRHYLLDVCVNPVRIDSWAGMALARGSLLETKLNSCEPLKSEMDFLKQAASAQRCFQRALDIEANHSLMWIEFGSFVYMVHSFCSRLLKQETDCLSLEMFEILENRKEKMLDIAVKCFTSASKIWYSVGEDNGIQDERWLHQYMLGKVAEKRDHDPSVYLGHFSKAAEHLHENRASYARKISYNNPQNLSVEALEVYYRIHACILKYLEQNEGKKLEKSMKKLFEKLLKSTAEGPFMAVNTKETEVKIDSDDERKKRTHLEALEDVFDDVTYVKKARLDLPLDICLMEDVIDVMEEVICKVVDIENNRKQSEEGSKISIKTEVVVKQEALSKDNVKDEAMEIIILDDSLPKAFESPSEDNLQADPLSLDADNSAIRKELKEGIGENGQLNILEDPVEKLDVIDLAMEVVEEIVDDMGDIEMEQDEDKPDRSKTVSDIEVSECSKMQVARANKDIPVGISVKVNDSESKYSQLMVDDKQLNDRNVDGDEGDDGDDEYDDDDDKMDVKDKLLQENIKPETDKVKIPENEIESVVNVISAVTANRRSSQESSLTTTTTTGTSTANSSSSSSDSEGDSSSSNDDSSSSSSSSDSDSSDSNSNEQNTAVKTSSKITEGNKKDAKKESEEEEEEEENDNQDHYELVKRCLVALEECVLRFPQHYKSLYRLTHYYFHSKFHRNISKCQDLLLGTYKCLPLKGRPLNASFQGLFADRKSTNFFNGVWRIPVSEIDRPGSFASHMSRCVLLLMEVLREVKDHRMLLELCLQLKRIPEADKKYLRDTEREQLCHQALALDLQAMRTKLREGPVTTSLVLEVYRAYQRIQRHLPQKEAVFASLLTEAYQKHAKVGRVILDQAIRFCQQEILASRAAANPSAVTTTLTTATLTVTTTTTTPVQLVSTTPVFSTGATITTTASPQFQRKMVTPTVKTTVSSSQPASRPRGRPPNVSKVGSTTTKSQPVTSRISSTKMSLPQLGSIIPTALSSPATALPFYAFPGIFTDPSLINAAVQSKLPMLDQEVLNFLNRHAHVGGYQAEFLRHFVGGNIPNPLIPNVAVSQSQKSPGTPRSSSSTYKAHANPQTSTPLPPSISITPLPSSQMPAHCNTSTTTSSSIKYSNIKNPKTPTSTPSLQQKLQASQALAKSTSSRSSPLNLTSPGKSNTLNQPSLSYSKGNTQKSTSLNITTSSYVKPRDQISFSNQPLNSNPYTSLLKGGEGMLTPGVSISQVTSAPITSTTTTMKPSAPKLMNFRKHAISSLQGSHSQEQSNIPKDVLPQYKSSCSSDNTKLPTSPVKRSDPLPSSKIHGDSSSKSRSLSGVQNSSVTKNSQNISVVSNIATSKGQIATIGTQISEQKAPAMKSKSPENKDSSIFKNQSGTKGSRSPGTTSTTIRNIGHELTLTPSLPQPTPTTVSTMSMLSRLQQQSSDLEIFSTPKSTTLDLSVQIPSSITITPKQQGNPSPSGGDSFRPSAKKFKDTVSITEVSRKVPSVSQNQKRTTPPIANRQDKAKPDKKEEKPAGGDVEIITLE